MFEAWMVTAASNAIMVVIYGALFVIMLRGIIQGRQWFSNPIATATAAIFITCTIGHGLHLAHAVFPADLGHFVHDASAARAMFGDWRMLGWDVITAAVAIWYWSLRSRLVVIFRGAALCEDLEQRHQQASMLHDSVVQGLAQAKLALELGRREEARTAVVDTLRLSRRILGEMLGDAEPTRT